MSESQLEWKGYAVCDTSKWNEFQLIDFKPKPAGEFDVDIKIEFCGVCGSDVHTITGGWGKPCLPLIVGHEIVGTVVWIGPKVQGIRIGDRAGVGAQICSCLKCNRCDNDDEQYCLQSVGTYNSAYSECGTVSQGGYATAIRAHERFVFPIPDGLKLEDAAPMLCAGLTVYSPLVRNGAGHFGVLWAKALGCKEIVVLSHSERKREDAFKMGATKFVVTEPGYEKALTGSLDLIISTTDAVSAVKWEPLVSLLKVHGRFIMVGIPDEELPAFKATLFLKNGPLVGGSKIGSKKEAMEMLKLAAEKNIRPWIELLPSIEASRAVTNVKEGKVKYRHVLK
ncbi:NADPH-dependent alcohol dehydrogenase [Macrolepiota fuliginosa MF-IS2]|uniref:NADPH-dependent alcohol dehydrogenase n=1 Tax=Macrolepiota fuliginosa MF-IS2 TaxID=1400762 RepID=A0A9P6C1W4_9AGAR|nr:NADPH-dependent alcohol dehydrogenase [Macrolepiota fuliginosa MF-IS2]